MTNQTIVPTPMAATGVAQESIIAQPTGSTILYAPSGNKDFIVIGSSSGTVTVTVQAVAPCDMPLACYQGTGAGKPNDHGLHNFIMSVTSSGSYVEKTFVIPYIDHYVDPSQLDVNGNAQVALACDAGMQTNGKIGIFEMP